MKTCGWYVSVETPECGRPATTSVKVKTKLTTATVPLCAEHKSVHDGNFARARKTQRLSDDKINTP